MNDAILWLSLAWDNPLTKQVLICGLGAWFGKLVYRSGTKRDRRANVARRGVGTYLATGTKTEALTLNPDRVVEAAEKHRQRIIEQKLKERKPFEAWCFCPKCDRFDCHWLWANTRHGMPKLIHRVCKNCGVTWDQLS